MLFCLKLPQGLLYVSVNSKGFSETVLMLMPNFLVAYVISFSCIGSILVYT